MDMMQTMMEELFNIRMARLHKLNLLIDQDDSQPVNSLIADMINILENIYVMINMPEEGFVSLTPKSEE